MGVLFTALTNRSEVLDRWGDDRPLVIIEDGLVIGDRLKKSRVDIGVTGAMITTAGVVFSLTVVSLQLASGQFSPRVLRTFVRDRLSQVVIGTLVATFVYCTLVLRYTSQDEQFVPTLPIGLALVLVVITVILIMTSSSTGTKEVRQ
jgi:uncharacterized membrane protein